MTDYARVRMLVEVSENSDYSTPYIKEELSDTLTPDESRWQKVQADTGGTTLTISNFASVTALAVQNLDSTNFVTVTHRSAGNSSTDNIMKLLAGDIYFTQDVTASGNVTLTADTAAVTCRVFVVGT